MKIEVYGTNSEPDTFYCHEIANKIASVLRGETNSKGEPITDASVTPQSVEVVFQSYLEIDYIKKLKLLQKEYGGLTYHHHANQIAVVDGKYVGDKEKFVAYAKKNGYLGEGAEFCNDVINNRLAREEFVASVAARGNRPMVYMEFADGSKFVDETTPVYGKIVIELFHDAVPIACKNFQLLCTGEKGATEMAKLHYQGSPVHRVVKGGWLQGGDIVLGDGSGSWAAIGQEGKVQDESFVCDFSNPLGGMVGFTTSQAHSIGSQFFITLGACEWMNGDYVGVGRVIQGFETLRRINQCSTTNQKPDPSIIVVKSGKHIVM
jgi:cyclophilin family peptidyl-prolyl cis-trans isomerase